VQNFVDADIFKAAISGADDFLKILDKISGALPSLIAGGVALHSSLKHNTGISYAPLLRAA